jgi:hypothetical protein
MFKWVRKLWWHNTKSTDVLIEEALTEEQQARAQQYHSSNQWGR